MTLPKLWNQNFILCCLASFLMAFAFYLIGSVMPFYIVEEFKTNEAQTGLILACYITASLVVRPFSGFLVDTYSRKNIFIYSLVIFTLLFYGYMKSKTLLLFIVFRILHGFMWSLTTTSSSTLTIDIIPSERRGEGVGYFGLTSTLAMAIGPMLGLMIYDKFPVEVNFYSAIFFSTLALILTFFISVPKKIPTVTAPISFDRFILLKAVPIGINLLGIGICYGALFGFAAKFGKSLALQDTGMFFMFMAVGMTLSRIFTGKLIDKGYIHQLMIYSLILLTLSLLVFGFATNAYLFFGSAFFIGIAYGILSPTFQNLFINLAIPSKRGTANSTFFSFYDMGIGLGMVLAGSVATSLNYSYIFLIGGIITAFALVFYIFISKPLYNKNKVVQ